MATIALYRFSLVCCIIAFVFMAIAFASPFWYQSWRRVHSPFGNIGLWHVCLNGYIMPRDPVMKSYVGCWWIHSTEFSLVKDDIQPAWFRFVQGFSILSLLADLAGMILVIIVFPSLTSLRQYRVRILFISAAVTLASAFLVFLISLVFAEMSNDSNWMPRPWMNYLSWSYGLCVVSGFFAAFGGMAAFVLGLIHKDRKLNGPPEPTADEINAKRMKLEKQDEMVRQQGGLMMEPVGQRPPYGSGPIYRPGQGQYQNQPAFQDRTDRKPGFNDPPPSYAGSRPPPSYAGSREYLPSGQRSTAGSQASRAGSQGTRAAESFV